MQLTHILVPTDQSDAARHALTVALALAQRAGARVTVMTVTPSTRMSVGTGPEKASGQALSRLKQWTALEVSAVQPGLRVDFAVSYGNPGIEICGFAEEYGVDLIVVGRKHRSQANRLLLGDTADAIARRSGVCCLFVPLGAAVPERVLVALDGSRRSLSVLQAASGFSQAIGASMAPVTIESLAPQEFAALVPSSRTVTLREITAQLAEPLLVRRGPVAETLLATADELGADTIAIGFHRGGPAGVLEGGSIARRVAHTAACAVLTIPF